MRFALALHADDGVKYGVTVPDLPGGGRRLVMPAHGVQCTIVNGAVLYEEQKHTGALPGQVLRSGGR